MENGHEPATKADIKALRDELIEADRSLRDDLSEVIRESQKTVREELLEAMHDIETKLLRAFYDFAETNQKQVSELVRTNTVVFDRITTIERRLLEVEKRLNMPPGA